MNNNDLVDVLNGLVRILNDRTHGFETAVEDNKDPQLDDQFRRMIMQSRQFRSELAEHIVRIDPTGVEDSGTTDISSKLHRAWIDIKAAVTGKDRDTVLSSVQFGENAAIEAYEEALNDENLPAFVKEVVQRQLTELRASRDQFVAMRQHA